MSIRLDLMVSYGAGYHLRVRSEGVDRVCFEHFGRILRNPHIVYLQFRCVVSMG